MGQCPGTFRGGKEVETFELVGSNDVPKPKGLGRLVNLHARLKSSGRVGSVVAFDPRDALHTYKLRFADGASPEMDWFAEALVCLCSDSFTVVVQTVFESDDATPSFGEEFELSGLTPGDSLASLYERVEARVNVARAKLHLNLLGSVPGPSQDLSHSLGLCGLGEGAQVECVISDFDPALLQIKRSSPESEYHDGEVVTREVVALVYGTRQSARQLLLWAAVSSRHLCGQGRGHGEVDIELSADRSELIVTRGVDAGAAARFRMSAIMSQARDRKPSSLEQQFKDRFGEETWPLIQGRLARKIIASL